MEISWADPLKSFPGGLSPLYPQPSEPCFQLLLPPLSWTTTPMVWRKKQNHINLIGLRGSLHFMDYSFMIKCSLFCVVVNFIRWDETHNPLGDDSLSTSVRTSPGRFTEVGRLVVSRTILWPQVVDWTNERKQVEHQHSLYLCFLSGNKIRQAPRPLPLHPETRLLPYFLCHNDDEQHF